MVSASKLRFKADLSRTGFVYRLDQMRNAGVKIPEHYVKYGQREFPEYFAEMFINWKPRKPGPKRKVDDG